MRSRLAADGLPLALLDTGLADRFRYRRGASGRRYLFTEVAGRDLEDYVGAVVLMTDEAGGAALFVGEVTAEGTLEGRTLGAIEAGRPARTRVFVHLLAGESGSRRRVREDLVRAG